MRKRSLHFVAPRRIGVRHAVAEDRHALQARLALSAGLLLTLAERRALAHGLLLRLRKEPLEDWCCLERGNGVGERRLLRLPRRLASVVVLLDERAPRFDVSEVLHSRVVLFRSRRELSRSLLKTLLSVREIELEPIDRRLHPVVERVLGRILRVDRRLLLLRGFASDEIQHVDHLVARAALAVSELCVLFAEVDVRRLPRLRL